MIPQWLEDMLWLLLAAGGLVTAALIAASVQGARADRLTKKINVNMLSQLTRDNKPEARRE